MTDLDLLKKIESEIKDRDIISRKDKIGYQSKIKKIPTTIKGFKKEYPDKYDQIKRSEPINRLIEDLLEIQKIKSNLLKLLWNKSESSFINYHDRVIV